MPQLGVDMGITCGPVSSLAPLSAPEAPEALSGSSPLASHPWLCLPTPLILSGLSQELAAGGARLSFPVSTQQTVSLHCWLTRGIHVLHRPAQLTSVASCCELWKVPTGPSSVRPVRDLQLNGHWSASLSPQQDACSTCILSRLAFRRVNCKSSWIAKPRALSPISWVPLTSP